MKRKSPLLAKLVILLSVIIGVSSFYLANKYKESAAAKSSQIAKLKDEDSKLSSILRDAKTILVNSTPAPKLDSVLSALLVDVMAYRLETGVFVTTLLPSKSVSTSDISTFETMREKVTGTELKSVRLNIVGTYSSYAGFLDYIQKLRSASVAVVFLKIQANSFELGLRAYGV